MKRNQLLEALLPNGNLDEVRFRMHFGAADPEAVIAALRAYPRDDLTDEDLARIRRGVKLALVPGEASAAPDPPNGTSSIYVGEWWCVTVTDANNRSTGAPLFLPPYSHCEAARATARLLEAQSDEVAASVQPLRTLRDLLHVYAKAALEEMLLGEQDVEPGFAEVLERALESAAERRLWLPALRLLAGREAFGSLVALMVRLVVEDVTSLPSDTAWGTPRLWAAWRAADGRGHDGRRTPRLRLVQQHDGRITWMSDEAFDVLTGSVADVVCSHGQLVTEWTSPHEQLLPVVQEMVAAQWSSVMVASASVRLPGLSRARVLEAQWDRDESGEEWILLQGVAKPRGGKVARFWVSPRYGKVVGGKEVALECVEPSAADRCGVCESATLEQIRGLADETLQRADVGCAPRREER